MLEAETWADRLSANIELAVDTELRELAPAKSHIQIEDAMTTIGGALYVTNAVKHFNSSNAGNAGFTPSQAESRFRRVVPGCKLNWKLSSRNWWFAWGLRPLSSLMGRDFGFRATGACFEPDRREEE